MDKEIKNIIYMFKRAGIIGKDEYFDINKIKSSITNKKEFDLEKKTLENERTVYEVINIEDKIVLRLLNDYLKSKKDYYQVDRRTQIKLILNELLTSNIKIVKIDIKEYYNTIELSMLEKIIFRNDNIYESEYRELLNKYFKTAKAKNTLLPGLSPANILAEILGKELDKKIKKKLIKKDISYKYFRYVDDILIVVKNNKDFDFKEEIEKVLKEYSLRMNEEKFEEIEINEGDKFVYLGYEFHYVNSKWKIGIEKKKVDKLEEKLKKIVDIYKKRIDQCKENRVEVKKVDRWYYENLKYLFYYKVYKGYKGIYYTGFSYNYCELYNDFNIEIESTNLKEIETLLYKTYSYRLGKFNGSPPYYIRQDLLYYIKNKKKLIFIDEKRYMSKGKLIDFILLNYEINKEQPNILQKKYYEVCNIYRKCFELQ